MKYKITQYLLIEYLKNNKYNCSKSIQTLLQIDCRYCVIGKILKLNNKKCIDKNRLTVINELSKGYEINI